MTNFQKKYKLMLTKNIISNLKMNTANVTSVKNHGITYLTD